MQLRTCKGGRKKRPTIFCEQRFDNAKSCLCRANCPVVLSCAVCFRYRCYVPIGSSGVLCVGEKTGGRERSNNTCRKIKKQGSNTQQHILYPVLLYVRKKAHSAANCPVVLSCAVCFCCRCYVLIGSTGVICLGEKTGGRGGSNSFSLLLLPCVVCPPWAHYKKARMDFY